MRHPPPTPPHVVFCLWGLCGENFQMSRSFKSTKPPVWRLGGKTTQPWETVARSAVGRQAEGSLRCWKIGNMSVVSCFQHPPLLRPVSWRTADVASIDQFPSRPCGLWDWLVDWLTDRQAHWWWLSGRQEKKIPNHAWSVFCFITYFISIDAAE